MLDMMILAEGDGGSGGIGWSWLSPLVALFGMVVTARIANRTFENGNKQWEANFRKELYVELARLVEAFCIETHLLKGGPNVSDDQWRKYSDDIEELKPNMQLIASSEVDEAHNVVINRASDCKQSVDAYYKADAAARYHISPIYVGGPAPEKITDAKYAALKKVVDQKAELMKGSFITLDNKKKGFIKLLRKELGISGDPYEAPVPAPWQSINAKPTTP